MAPGAFILQLRLPFSPDSVQHSSNMFIVSNGVLVVAKSVFIRMCVNSEPYILYIGPYMFDPHPNMIP